MYSYIHSLICWIPTKDFQSLNPQVNFCFKVKQTGIGQAYWDLRSWWIQSQLQICNHSTSNFWLYYKVLFRFMMLVRTGLQTPGLSKRFHCSCWISINSLPNRNGNWVELKKTDALKRWYLRRILLEFFLLCLFGCFSARHLFIYVHLNMESLHKNV